MSRLYNEPLKKQVRESERSLNRRDRLRAYSPLLKRGYMIHSAVVDGIDGKRVEVHARAVQINRDAPMSTAACIKIGGIPTSDADHISHRVTMALCSAGLNVLDVRVQVMVHPVITTPVGSCLDLPIAIAVMQAAGVIDREINTEKYLLFGELDSAGQVRRLPTALALGLTAVYGQHVICPGENGADVALACEVCGNVTVRPVATLETVYKFFVQRGELRYLLLQACRYRSATPDAPDFSLLRGNAQLKRILMVAAAGGLSALLQGGPGNGKSFAVQCFAGILPAMNKREMIESTRAWSIGGVSRSGEVVCHRPIRTVHATASRQALIGGGSGGVVQPGEITLAQNGVLFLDEAAEFSKSLLDALRQPLQDGYVNISRVGAYKRLPARFMFVAAMNMCPCGYYPTEQCTCTPRQVLRYQNRLSGPIMDRIDLRAVVEQISVDEQLGDPPAGLESPTMRELVETARERQRIRYNGTSINCNGQIPPGEMPRWCQFSAEGDKEYRQAAADGLSNRGRDRLAKVARTIADLEASELIEARHVVEAEQYMV